MRYCIKRKKKKYKDRIYIYYEVHHTYRDPDNWRKVRSIFVTYLGKNKKDGLKKLRAKSQAEHLIGFLDTQMKKMDH